MPIGGESRFVDVNPVRVELDQVTVDSAIAQIVESEQNPPADTPDNAERDTTTKGSSDRGAASNENINEQEDPKNLPVDTPDTAEGDTTTKDPRIRWLHLIRTLPTKRTLINKNLPIPTTQILKLMNQTWNNQKKDMLNLRHME